MTLTLHERIRSDIESGILSGALAPGDRLPVEHELMRTYNCARMTVNKALSALAAAGLVERRKRAGSFVARPRLHSMIIDVPDLPTEVSARGKSYRFELLDRRVRAAVGPDERMLAGRGKLVDITGLHHADDVPLAIEHRLIALKAAAGIADADLGNEPPGTWLLRNIAWTEAETRVSAIAADAATAMRLGIETGAACLVVERSTWRGSDPITTVRQTFPGSAYDLVARFGQDAVRARNG